MTHASLDVVVVGNVGIDTNIYLPGAEIDFSVEANFTDNVDYVGQAGGYASRGYAQLGWRTAFIGYVGADFSGRFIREEFARDGVDTSALFVDPAGTSRSINCMYRDGRRKNFYDGKGHMHLQPDLPACQRVLAGAKLAHFNLPNWARRLLPLVKTAGGCVACDLQDVVALDDPYRQDFIRAADILFLSATNHPDPTPLIHTLVSAKPEQIVVVGMGARGCALGTHAGVEFFPPVAMEAPVIDTNGAGDGLAVGFLSSYVLEGYSLQESVRRGQIVARYTCTQRATSSHLITREQLASFFRK
jgi:sugar/nucleoside kinase (ribokinase family)